MDLSLSVHLPGDARSVPVARALGRQVLEPLELERTLVEQVVLALSELCANAVRHAGSRGYELRLDVDGARCRVSVVDGGPGFGPELPPPGTALEGGSGLAIVRALADLLVVGTDPDGRHRVTFEKSLVPARETLPG